MRSSAWFWGQSAIRKACVYGMKYLEHDYRVASDDDHAYPDLLTAWSLLQRLVEDDVEIDLCQH